VLTAGRSLAAAASDRPAPLLACLCSTLQMDRTRGMLDRFSRQSGPFSADAWTIFAEYPSGQFIVIISHNIAWKMAIIAYKNTFVIVLDKDWTILGM